MPVIVIVAELFVTPATGVQVGFLKVGVLSSVKPAASAGQEMITSFPEREIWIAGRDAGGGRAMGIPSADAPPSDSISAFDSLPARI